MCPQNDVTKKLFICINNNVHKETYWVHKLDILYPKGLNAKVLYKI